MDDLVFTDALTGDQVGFNPKDGSAWVEKKDGPTPSHTSIFFPGCSFINYAMPLVQAVNATLMEHGLVDGMSVLCCGKILSYEPQGDVLRSSFEEQLRQHVYEAKIKRIICACPNCIKAMREAFANDPRTSSVELVVLPRVLADLGYQLDKQVVAQLMRGDKEESVLLCTHDSCPDREYGEFADALRAVIPAHLWVDPEHTRTRSVCCGSLPRAAGKEAQADKCADLNGREALEVSADAIVTACMSCAFQLNMAQSYLPAVHFLELLYNWRIDWDRVGQWMKLRFLFDETLGATEKNSARAFQGLGGESSKEAPKTPQMDSGESE